MKQTERLTFTQKNANNKKWYKDKADYFDTLNRSTFDRKSMQVNYDLFNNKVDIRDFEYICKPFGSDIGELPARMTNKDIVSGKIKAIMGMEMKRPFTYRVISTNPEATTQREKKEFEMIREYIVGQIMAPIQEEVMQNAQAQVQGQELTPEQQQQIQQQMQAEIEQRTPEEIKQYMKREYQDPAEVLGTQLLQYLTNKLDLKDRFNELFKHLLLSSMGVMYVGILNDEPVVWNVNSMNFAYGMQSDVDTVEDSEWAVCHYRMTPSQIVRYFNEELSQDDLDEIFSKNNVYAENYDLFSEQDSLDTSTLAVSHCVWKALRKIGFLTYVDDGGEMQETLVDESYKLNTEAGDLNIEWKWIPEVYETWKIKTSKPIYVNMRPIPGQFKDLDNLYYSKLPYYGIVCDNMNSTTTSLMDRIKSYQYLYNVIMYRLELLLASDRGKKFMMNISAIPDDMKTDVWQYFMESTSMIWYNNKEEGTVPQDVNTVGKVIDLSLMSDIQKYIELAEYIRVQAGKSVGITDQVEGQINQYDAVNNVNTSLQQSAFILEPYFNLLAIVKRNVLQALLNTAKVAYGTAQPRKLTYVLDDYSKEIINLDPITLDNSTLGIFVADSYKANQLISTIQQLAHAALQNQQATLSDIIKILKEESVPAMEEILKVAEDKAQEKQMQMQQQQQEFQKELEQMQQQAEQQKFEYQKELTLVKEQERRKTEITKMAILGASYNPDKDKDNNKVNDFLQMVNEDGSINPSMLAVAREVNEENTTEQSEDEQTEESNDTSESGGNKSVSKTMMNMVR